MQQERRSSLRSIGSLCEAAASDNDPQLHAQVKPRLKRRKNHHAESDHPSNSALILLDIENLRPHFHLPLGQAAKKIGVCKTALKKACRKIGIVGWPFRKLRAVERRIAACVSKRQSESKAMPATRILKTNEDVVEKLLDLKRQLLDGKDFGKGFSSLGIDEDDWSDLDMPIDGDASEVSVLSQDMALEALDDSLPSVPSVASQSAGLTNLSVEKGGLLCAFGDSQSCCTASASCAANLSQSSRSEEHGSEALNDILRSGGNPFASEFINLSNEFSMSNSLSGHTSWNPTPPTMPETSPSLSSSAPSLAQSAMLSADMTRSLPELGGRDGDAASSTWTVRDELRSLQSLVRVLLMEQEELTNELKLSQVLLAS